MGAGVGHISVSKYHHTDFLYYLTFKSVLNFCSVVVVLLSVARQAVIDLQRKTVSLACVVMVFLVDINGIAQSGALYSRWVRRK